MTSNRISGNQFAFPSQMFIDIWFKWNHSAAKILANHLMNGFPIKILKILSLLWGTFFFLLLSVTQEHQSIKLANI